MIRINLKTHLRFINFFFLISVLIFVIAPLIDIKISSLFFFENSFISEKFTIIKSLRIFLKNFMVTIPFLGLFFFLFILKKKKKKELRFKLAVLGLLIGPIIGCGVIANLIFKENWGRARPVHITEFGGNKIFTNPFIKSNQCETNCSWISGETSGAFSFMVGTIILRNHIFFIFNWFLGLLVFFCRLSMGGHFFSDNLFSLFLMIYLAYGYRYLVYLYIRNLSKR